MLSRQDKSDWPIHIEDKKNNNNFKKLNVTNKVTKRERARARAREGEGVRERAREILVSCGEVKAVQARGSGIR